MVCVGEGCGVVRVCASAAIAVDKAKADRKSIRFMTNIISPKVWENRVVGSGYGE